MKIFQGTLMAATLLAAGTIGATNFAHADVLNLPASAALMSGDPIGSGCEVNYGPNGIAASAVGGICDFDFPLTVPVGYIIQQIKVVHGTDNGAGPLINTYLSVLDYATGAAQTKFQWTSGQVVPAGTFAVTRLMAQSKLGAYLEAFTVQPYTMYQVVVHLENGAFATGLEVTYQQSPQ